MTADTTTSETTTESTESGSDSVVLTDTAAGKVKALSIKKAATIFALLPCSRVAAGSAVPTLLRRPFARRATRRLTSTALPVVDRMSVPYLGGAVIDFVDTIEKQGFTIDNPNATGSCAWEIRSTNSHHCFSQEPARTLVPAGS